MASVAAAQKVVDEILETIEELSDSVKLKAADYFESVEERAKSIMENVEKRDSASDAQMTALNNMLEGGEKWRK